MYQIGNVYFIAAIAVVGGGLFGFDIASMSAIIGTEQYKCYFNEGSNVNGQCAGPSSSTQGGITAAMPGGSYVGALASGFLTDIIGRRRSIQLGCLIWIIGSIIISASQDIGMLIAGRFINGLCVGICSAQVPVYISEIAPPTKRGRLTGLQQWSITWGIMIMFYISYGTSYMTGTGAFRVPWALQMIPAIFLFFAFFFVPESPRWLGRKGRWEEAHAVLTLVHGKGDPSSPFVTRELKEIRDMTEFEANNADVSYLELLKPKMIYRTHIAVMTQVWSQLTGMNAMMYYITYIFLMAGESGSANLVASSIQYVINVVMTVPALLFVDRWGRRPTLVLGAFFMAVFMFSNAAIMAVDGHAAPPGGYKNTPEASWEVRGAASKALIACTYLFVASYAPSWGPVSWVYPPELFTVRTRGKGVALATSANWAFNFALGYFVPPAFETIKWKTYIIFGVFNLAMMLHAFFAFPETAGKTLEETREMFEDPNGVKYIGTIPWKTHVVTKRTRDLERAAQVDDRAMSTTADDHEVKKDSSSDTSPERREADETKN